MSTPDLKHHSSRFGGVVPAVLQPASGVVITPAAIAEGRKLRYSKPSRAQHACELWLQDPSALLPLMATWQPVELAVGLRMVWTSKKYHGGKTNK